MFCPNCGAKNQDGAQRCAQCGAVLALGAPSAAPVVPGVVPPEIKGFNFGAFALNWIWALAHRLWGWGVIMLVASCVPIVNLGVALYLGFKGNELAWQAKPFASVQQFKETQKGWTIAGIIILILGVLAIPMMSILAAVAIPNFLHAKNRAQFTSCQQQLANISTAAQDYLVEHDSFSDLNSVDDLCIHIFPGMDDPAECAGQIQERVDKVCKPGTLQFKLVDDYSYEVHAEPAIDKYCPICASEAGLTPRDYSSDCPVQPECLH